MGDHRRGGFTGDVGTRQRFAVTNMACAVFHPDDHRVAFFATLGGVAKSLMNAQLDELGGEMLGRQIEPSLLEGLGDGFIVQDWIDMNHSLFSALWLEKTAIAITIGLIVMVAALNIVATLILMVMEKHKDIAILVSMGATRGAIMRVFMLQGTIIGAVGTLLGGVAGWGTCRLLDRYRLIRIPEDVYQIAWVPFRLLPGVLIRMEETIGAAQERRRGGAVPIGRKGGICIAQALRGLDQDEARSR